MSTFEELLEACRAAGAGLVAVSKTRTEKEIMTLYKSGQRIFGENRAHELIIKASLLPTDIQWHLIGHLQTNKVKSLLPYVSCIQSLDSVKLWQKINQDATEENLKMNCLLQIKIASEETKYGWDMSELEAFLEENGTNIFPHVVITGIMGMATLTGNKEQVRKEFSQLKLHYENLRSRFYHYKPEFQTLSMGMSGDYHIALEEGSTMIRIGSLLFGKK